MNRERQFDKDFKSNQKELKEYEKELEKQPLQESTNKHVQAGDFQKEHMVRSAHRKKRHRISKKRFMKCIDIELITAALKSANLDDSLLWKKDFDVNKLSFEKFMNCRRDMLKMEVIMEALKEGLLDKPGLIEIKKPDNPSVPTEDTLNTFEEEMQINLKKQRKAEEAAILERMRYKALELGAANVEEGNEEAIATALDETKELLNKLQRQRKLLGEEKFGQDPYKRQVKTLREPDSPDDDWSEITSTTTGSYKSWRRGDSHARKEKHHFRPKLKNLNWADEERHLGIRFIAALIIFGYWVHYISRAFKRLWYDIYTENLIIHNIWPIILVKESLEWSYIVIKLHDWFHCIFTVIAPSIVIGNHTSLGVLYGFSIMIDAFIYVYAKGHDLLFEPNEPTWETAFLLIIYAACMSGLVVFFLILLYIVEDSVRLLRETSHRKVRRLNRIIHAKCCGNLEQRMIAWDWMIQHATQRELRKLSRLYPEIKKVNGHYPLPEKHEVEFNLGKELRLFRLRHMFYDVTMAGGWINMEKYQEDLFGSGESSEEEPLTSLQQRKKKLSKANFKPNVKDFGNNPKHSHKDKQDNNEEQVKKENNKN